VSRIFPKNSRQIAAKILIGLMLLSLLSVMGVTYYFTPKYTRVGYEPIQPMPFSHAQHAGQLGIDCLHCHNHVVESPIANVPSADVCMNCHAADRGGILADSPMLAALRAAHGSPQRSLDWVRVHKLPEHAYFDHAVHVARGVSCLSCHGQVDEMVAVRVVEPMSMAWCLDCHREPEKFLRPVDQVTNMNWDPVSALGQSQLELGEELKLKHRVQGMQYMTNCSSCHR
jgi:hypothetical protein